MKQNAEKFGLSLAALILAVLLVGTAVLAPCLVSAEDGGGGRLIQGPSGIRMEGPGEREPVTPSFASPGDGDILFEQPPYAPSDPYYNAWYSDTLSGWLCFEDFWGLTEDIGDIHWYGFSVYYPFNCDPMGMEFQIIFYQDAGGAPGAPVATFSNVIPAITYYDTYIFGGWEPLLAYRFEVADLGTPVSLTNGWVSIQATYSPYGCSFGWLTSPAGNWNAIQEPYGTIYDNLAFALTEAQPPPPPNVKYLHAEDGLIDLADPVGTQWHELWPIFCRQYHMSSWNDTSGDGVLSYCDRIDMYEKPDGEVRWYHVENVTITLLVTPMMENHLVDENSFYSPQAPLQGAPQSMYIELEGGYDPAVLTAPNCTYWHEIYPDFCREYHLVDWIDTGNPNGELSFCDYISLEGPDIYPVMCPLDEDFSGSWLPSGWTQEQSWEWQQSPSNNAGGTSPEAWLAWYYISGNYSYLDSKPVDTTGAPSLTLEFKSFIDDTPGAWDVYECRVYTRAHETDGWTKRTPWPNPIMGDVGPNTYSIDISSDIGTATQVRFEFNGYYYDINHWFVDDVKICYPVWWHVEEVAIDIVVTPETPPVGGEAYPVSKASLLAPWIAVGLFLAGGISWYILRRRRSQS